MGKCLMCGGEAGYIMFFTGGKACGRQEKIMCTKCDAERKKNETFMDNRKRP